MPVIRRGKTKSALRFSVMAVAFGLAISFANAQSPRSSGELALDSLPQPPAQKRAFAAPANSKLPEKLLSATAALFDIGVADPRDCEYRTVKVGVGDIWSGGGGTVQVHGWVLPVEETEKTKGQRFAIAWNGLVYPIIELGEKSDLEADIKSACKADEDAREAAKKDRWRGRSFRLSGAIPERTSVSEHELLPIKVCVLVRLGRTALAERAWSDWIAGIQQNDRELDDPYLTLAGDWLWALYDRAVTAHMRGDDRLALADLRRLASAKKQATNLAKERGIEHRGGGIDGETTFEFLEPAPRLLADHERRNAEKRRARVALAEIKDAGQRVATLISDLDQVRARQMGQPGGVALGEDPVVRALIDEGDAAVEPLIRCLETDDRLTRSVHFWRDFARSRSPIGVHEAAYVALSGILGESFFVPESTGDDISSRGDEQRKRLADAIRAYLDKYGHLTREERWFAILADDKAGPNRWLNVVQNIMRPADEEPHPSSMFDGGGWVKVPSDKPGDRRVLRGEVLRKKVSPSVGDLLAKRLRAISQASDDQYRRGLRGTVELAQALAVWDGKAHLQDLHDFTEVLRTAFSANDAAQPYLGQPLVKLYLKRAQLGDESAIDEYAHWVQDVTPRQAGYGAEGIFEPLWRFSDRPAITAAAEKLFGSKDSPWNLAIGGHTGSSFDVERVLQTPVLGLPVVRKQLLAQLQDKSQAGTVECTDRGSLRVHRLTWNESRGMADKDDPLRSALGAITSFRTCDLVAEQLSRIAGFPRIELYWPEDHRNDAVKRTNAVMTQFGERLVWSTEQEPLRTFSEAVMTFPQLNRPATSEDVAKGMAIFALDGERRVWKMPSRPIKARWESLHTSPANSSQFDMATGESKMVTTWRTEGYVWQAEEVHVGAKWLRWFGFVGPGFLGKAPAEEIELELPDHWQWVRFAKGIEWRLRLPDVNTKDNSLSRSILTENKPLHIELHVRNVLGVEQRLPSEWYRAVDNALVQGVQIRLLRLAKSQAAKRSDAAENWVEMPLNPIGNFPADRAGTLLGVGVESPMVVFDLRLLFAIEKAGAYRLELAAAKTLSGDKASQPFVTYFTIRDDAESRQLP
jgi:hypothetical protein